MNRSALPRLSSDTALLVAEYVSGVLPADEHARVHALLSQDDVALAHALAWEDTLLGLVDALPPVQPDPSLRERLQQTLGIGAPPVPPSHQFLKRPSSSGTAAGPTAVDDSRVKVAGASGTSPHSARITPIVSSAAASAPTVTPQVNHHATSTPEPAAPSSGLPSVHEDTPSTSRISGDTPSRPAAHSSAPPSRVIEPTIGIEPAKETATPVISQSADLPSSETRTGSTASGHDPGKRFKSRRNRSEAPPTDKTPAAESAERALTRQLWIWRLVAVCASCAAITGFLLPSEPPPPPVQVIKVAPTRAAILMAPGTTSTPAWTVTLDHEGGLLMQPLVHTQVDPGQQTLLWTRKETMPEPRLLGRIDPNRPVQVPASQLGTVADDQLFEITLETDEDARNGVANGPILYIGRMTVFGSENALQSTGGPTAQ